MRPQRAIMTEQITSGPFDLLDARGLPVILDFDVARLFGIETKHLNQQLRRNPAKFDGFAFQLTPDEWESLRSQNVTSNAGRGGRRHPPYAFTEHGVVMAATVVTSQGARRQQPAKPD